jgi:hypothetical protein
MFGSMICFTYKERGSPISVRISAHKPKGEDFVSIELSRTNRLVVWQQFPKGPPMFSDHHSKRGDYDSSPYRCFAMLLSGKLDPIRRRLPRVHTTTKMAAAEDDQEGMLRLLSSQKTLQLVVRMMHCMLQISVSRGKHRLRKHAFWFFCRANFEFRNAW